MLEARTCAARVAMRFGAETFAPVVYGAETQYGEPLTGQCHDCGIQIGGLHHFGCDMEECPRCHEQLISCDCGGEFEKNMTELNRFPPSPAARRIS
jgi:hypothetical protein